MVLTIIYVQYCNTDNNTVIFCNISELVFRILTVFLARFGLDIH